MWNAISRPGGSADSQAAQSGRLVRALALQLSFLAGLWILFALNAASTRGQARDDAEQALANVSAAFAMDLSHQFELIDHALQAAAAAWHNDEIRALKPSLRQLVLFDRSMAAAAFGPLVIADSYGSVVARSDERQPDPYGGVSEPLGPQPVAPIDTLASRPEFKAQLGPEDFGLYVGSGFINPADGEWSIPVSRRITDSAGDFAGIVTGTLRMALVQDSYARMKLRSGGLLALATNEGLLLAHRPELRPNIGLAPPHLISIAGRTDGAEVEGVFEATSRVDGIQKLYSYHRVGALPLVQYSGMPIAVVYAGWRQRTIVMGCFLGFLSVGILLLQVMLGRELRSRIAAEKLLERLASQDALTGIANRRVFDAAVEQAWHLALRSGDSVGLLMIDVDHFKVFNDLYGHQAGDTALQAVAACLAAGAERCGGVAYRYGGEEFAVLFPTIVGPTGPIAQDLLLAIRRCNLPNAGAPAGIVTISIGTATATPRTGDTPAMLVTSADRALYAAKQAGRDRSAFAARATDDMAA